MYSAVLTIHSWLRFVVIALGLAVLFLSSRGLIRNVAWSRADERAHVGFIGALDLQLLLGLLLYFVLSPIVAAAHADMSMAMSNTELRFFGVEHITMMLLAVIVAHVGRSVSKRRQGRVRFRTALVAQALWLVLTAVAIPWPGFVVSRPLFRM